jgi:hypothetical protein
MYNALGSDLGRAHSFWEFGDGMTRKRLILRRGNGKGNGRALPHTVACFSISVSCWLNDVTKFCIHHDWPYF